MSPFLTRLYSPVEIGQLGLFLAFVQVATVATSLRYEQAVVIPARTADAARLVGLAIGLVPMVSLISAALLAALILLDVGGYGTLPLVAAPLAGLGLAGFGILTVLRYWLIRSDAYRMISQVQVVQSAGRAIAQVGFGLLSGGVLGLLVGDILGRLLGLSGAIRSAGAAAMAARRLPGLSTAAMARAYWRFPALGVPSSLLNAAAASLPVPLVAASYDLTMAGYLALVQRVLGLPLSVIGASVGDATLARVAEHARSDPRAALPLFRRLAIALFLVGLPIAIGLAVLGPWAFGIVFGPAWGTAGVVAAHMAPWLVSALIVSPLSRVAVVYQAQRTKLVYDVLALAAVVVSIAGGAAAGLDALEAIRLLAVLQTAAYAVYLLVLYRVVSRHAAAPIPADHDETTGR
ncbi:MAG: lipopolysaccharide biosynthesis protein [Candidatus Limnocylindria bacterium]